MVRFVAHFLIWTLTPFPLHRRSCRVDDNHKQYRSDNTIHFKIHISLEPRDHTRDRDQAQLNAITAVYPGSTVLLCWWHVLCVMRMHFQTEEFPRLWERVHEWVKMPNQSKFESWWDEMQNDLEVPLSFLDYLKINWMPIVPIWSGSARQHCTIFQESDTNMLIES